MSFESDRKRLATFADLSAVIGPDEKRPLTTAEIRNGQRVAFLHIRKQNPIHDAGMRDPTLFEEVERATGKEIIKYL
jgi:DUF917 family protein